MPRPRTFDTERVIDDALQTFWGQGYASTSVQNLVDATGLSRASLYNAFGDKHALFIAVLERYEAQWVRRVIDTLEQSSSSPRGAIRTLLEDVAEEAATCSEQRGCLMTNAATELGAHDPQTARTVEHNFERIQSALEEAVQNGQAAGEIAGDVNARAAGRFLANSIQGMRVAARTGPDRETLQDIVDVTLRALN